MESVSQGWRFLSIGWEADTTDVGGVNPWDVAPYRPPDHRRPPFLPVTTTHHVHQRGRQFQSANHLRSRWVLERCLGFLRPGLNAQVPISAEHPWALAGRLSQGLHSAALVRRAFGSPFVM